MKSEEEPRCALVTGANRGLGLELCRRFHALGYRVVAHVRKVPVDGELTDLKGLDLVHADFRDLTAVERLADEVAHICNGRLDVLVNNAGVGFHCRADRVISTEMSETFYVNALAPILLTSRLLPSIRAAQGCVINVTSRLIDRNMEFTAVYTAAKRALAGFADVVRLETGMRVTSIEPGAMETDFLRQTNDGPVVEFFANRQLERLDVARVTDLIVSVTESPFNVLIERIQVVPMGQVR